MSEQKKGDLLSAHTTYGNSFQKIQEALVGKRYSEQMKMALERPPEKTSETNHILALSKKIPLLTGFLNGVNNTSGSMSKLIETYGFTTHTSHALKNASPYAGLTLAIIDFIRLPMIYLAAFLVGEKLPITLSTRAEWLYSSVLLGLTITALTVPALAPMIAFVFAGIGLVVSLFTMGKAIHQRFKSRAEQKELSDKIADINSQLKQLIGETERLEADRNQKKTVSTVDPINNSSSEPESDEIKEKIENFNRMHPELLTLCAKQFKCQEEIKNTNNASLMARGIGLALSALVTVGLTLTLFFPPIGLALMAASFTTGLVCLVGELSFLAFQGVQRRFLNKKTIKPDVARDKSLEGQSAENETSHLRDDPTKKVSEAKVQETTPNKSLDGQSLNPEDKEPSSEDNETGKPHLYP